jgi:hypothetical protein
MNGRRGRAAQDKPGRSVTNDYDLHPKFYIDFLAAVCIGVIMQWQEIKFGLECLDRVRRTGEAIGDRVTPRKVIADGELPHKQCWYYLEKWAKRGWYGYGVSVDTGWIENEAEMRAALALAGEEAI